MIDFIVSKAPKLLLQGQDHKLLRLMDEQENKLRSYKKVEEHSTNDPYHKPREQEMKTLIYTTL